MKWVTTETVNLRILVPSGLTLAGLIGAGVGYFAASKILSKKYREIADREISEAKVYYQGLYSRPMIDLESTEDDEEDLDEDDDPLEKKWALLSENDQTRVMTEAVRAMKEYESDESEKQTPVVINNIFTHNTPPGEEVLAALLAERDASGPYIITKEEYFQNDPDHEQKSFTYYDGDGILVDDQDEFNPVYDIDRVAGEDNLLRFGYGSGGEHCVFIRNETLDPPLDLVITKTPGRYTDEVMGFNDDEPHLKHSQLRKFKLHDE